LCLKSNKHDILTQPFPPYLSALDTHTHTHTHAHAHTHTHEGNAN